VKSRDPSTTEALAVAGYDFVVADLEHSPLSVADVEGIVRACAAWEVAVLARVPPAWLGLCGPLLDAGVTGIQVSDISSAAAAAAARSAVRYPPSGSRSLSLATRAGRFGTVTARLHIASSDETTMLVGQIESAEGLAALRPVIECGVFDALFLGATDLSVALGHPGDTGHPAVAAALARRLRRSGPAARRSAFSAVTPRRRSPGRRGGPRCLRSQATWRRSPRRARRRCGR
jgi:4-hydroxy-2-oxoheptanedioate aldolase